MHKHMYREEETPPHHDHYAMMEREMKKRFFLTLILTLPVLLYWPVIERVSGLSMPRFPGVDWVTFALASIVVVYGGWVFYKGAVRALRRRVLDMMVLVSVAVLVGYIYSLFATFLFEEADVFYPEVTTLVVVLLLGHWLEMKAVRGASGAIGELVKLIPPKANLVKDGEILQIPTSEVKVGDILLVRPGEKIPVDGVIVEGKTSVNEAMITGEAKPVSKEEGDEVIGGAINGEGAIKVRAQRVGEDTALAQIIKLVEEAQASKPPVQRLADKVAHYLTIAALGAGTGTFFIWKFIIGQPTVFAITLAISVIVITCPHALGLAIPTVTYISTTLAAKRGMLVRNARALELATKLDMVVFDKTGTLTEGKFGVVDIRTFGEGVDEDSLLAVAAALEVNSEHVIAKGIVEEAKKRNLELVPVEGLQAVPGMGVEGVVEGKKTLVGNENLMKRAGIRAEGLDKLEDMARGGKSLVYIAQEGKLIGVIALSDRVREESKETVKILKRMGVKVAMLTGDNEETAKEVAEQLQLDEYFASVLPDEKAAKIRNLQERGFTVAMVGDGINDAPALVQADVGIAIGAGTDVALESADLILVRNNPKDVASLIMLSQATMRKMKQNLAWATGYNVVAIPAAAGALAPLGFFMKPHWAALVMAASTIIVALNAQLLRRAHLEG